MALVDWKEAYLNKFEERNQAQFLSPDEETVRRINRQIDIKYPTLKTNVSVAEYKAARDAANNFIKDNVGQNGIPARSYDRDASLKWYPASAGGKIEVDLRTNKDDHAKVTPVGIQQITQYTNTPVLSRPWIEMKAGASLERHCKNQNQPIKSTDSKTLFDYSKAVDRDKQTDAVRELTPKETLQQSQRTFDFAR
ncbi:hypothetical protein [Brucella gallinifaecis]|uniref:hypothetical protein n=1 Tax=Brucella gallinifaecis TaxID=215590 RepID=UPI00236193FE|nr:hypothetical protein [Brucella gallinifaecis]